MIEKKKKKSEDSNDPSKILGAGKNQLDQIRIILDDVESNIQKVKHLLFTEKYKNDIKRSAGNLEDSEVVEGVFDGENMLSNSGKKFLVSANYASKSKLVYGDILKLTITKGGLFIFKQIGPAERKNEISTLEENNGKYFVIIDGKKYNVLLASVTYFRAKVGNKLALILPAEGDCDWAAIENVI